MVCDGAGYQHAGVDAGTCVRIVLEDSQRWRMVTLAMREIYEIAPNMSTKAEKVHELLPTAHLGTISSVEESRHSERLPWLQYAVRRL